MGRGVEVVESGLSFVVQSEYHVFPHSYIAPSCLGHS